MLYLARELHSPTGEISRNAVVEVLQGIVNNIYSFAGEMHSMLLVDEIFLSFQGNLKSLSDIKNISHSVGNGRLYAYLPNVDGELALAV